MKTKSEQLFEDLCLRMGFSCGGIPTSTNMTPDYRVRFGSIFTLVDTKQIDKSPEIRNEDGSSSGRRTMGLNSIRGHIEKANKQFRAQKDENLPGIVVLYDNVGYVLEEMTIRLAMYGDLSISVARESTLNKDDRNVDISYAGNRKLSEKRCRAVSAVAHMTKDGCLLIYHNCYADSPIDPTMLNHYGIENYIIDNTNWVKIN